MGIYFVNRASDDARIGKQGPNSNLGIMTGKSGPLYTQKCLISLISLLRERERARAFWASTHRPTRVHSELAHTSSTSRECVEWLTLHPHSQSTRAGPGAAVYTHLHHGDHTGIRHEERSESSSLNLVWSMYIDFNQWGCPMEHANIKSMWGVQRLFDSSHPIWGLKVIENHWG